jgi:hypothetical protein
MRLPSRQTTSRLMEGAVGNARDREGLALLYEIGGGMRLGARNVHLNLGARTAGFIRQAKRRP